MPEARIMGLDYGEKNIGIAISDPLGITAQPLKVLKHTSLQEDLKNIVELCREYQVSRLVLGYPVNMDGSEGAAAQKTKKFREKLSAASGLEVHLWDERLSSAHAERVLLKADVSRSKRKKVRDVMAAVLILESFMSSPAAEIKQ